MSVIPRHFQMAIKVVHDVLQCLPGASGLLLGAKGSGRKTLIRLVAYIKQSKVSSPRVRMLYSSRHELRSLSWNQVVMGGASRIICEGLVSPLHWITSIHSCWSLTTPTSALRNGTV